MSSDLVDAIARAIGDPGSVTPRIRDEANRYMESVPRWSARAVALVLSDRDAALCDENERLTKRLADYEADWVPMMGPGEGLRIDGNGVMVSMHGARRVVKGAAAAMARMIGDAENYVECEMKPAGERGYTLTIRRSEKPTPHQLRQRAEAERDELQARIEALGGAGPCGHACPTLGQLTGTVCHLRHGHTGWHESADGTSWGLRAALSPVEAEVPNV